MTKATREALLQVDQILHEAGWDQPPPQPPALTEQNLEAMRLAYQTLLRSDYFEILQNTLGKGATIQEASRSLGITEEAAEKLFVEAINRLSDFVEVSDEQGLVAGSPTETATPMGR